MRRGIMIAGIGAALALGVGLLAARLAARPAQVPKNDQTIQDDPHEACVRAAIRQGYDDVRARGEEADPQRIESNAEFVCPSSAEIIRRNHSQDELDALRRHGGAP